ncbi:MAG: hypothetical protein ABI416_09590 [Ginsengibacter sp.]
MYKTNTKEKSLRVVFYYILYSILNEVLGYYFHEIRSLKDALVLYAIFTVVEFSSFCLFYYYAVAEGKMKKAVLPIGTVFLLFACVDFFSFNKMTSIDSIAIGVETILVILMSIYYLAVQIKGDTNLFVYSTSNFWIVITFLIYLSGNFFLYIMASSMSDDKYYRDMYTIINSVFIVLKNILLSVAMLMKSSETANKKILAHNDWGDPHSYKLKN